LLEKWNKNLEYAEIYNLKITRIWR